RSARVSDDLGVHVDDLVQIAAAYAEHRSARAGVVAVGHSVGATIVLGAALCAPAGFGAVGGYEPSMPWLGFHRQGRSASNGDVGPPADPDLEVERFFRRMVGNAAWDRLPAEQRASRLADGPALVADLRAIRHGTPYDVTALSVRTIIASGGPSSRPHHLDTADWLGTHVSCVRRSAIVEAGHGAHLSHPDAFATFVREVVAAGACAGPPG
ncbi:MAG TPA: alpha/beta fold hydrolase, partial [Acidimicrobiales bacterium]|nr:alpha/beta fold hydrolase [Acidimicrobiales bacterium]